MSAALIRIALPTARTMRWWPLIATGALVLGLVALARTENRPADAVLLVAAASLASLVVAATRDEAALMLEAVPVSVMRRRLVRVALMGAPTLILWSALVSLGDTGGAPGVGPLLALAATGIGLSVWAPAPWAVLAGTAAPVAWFALDRAAAGGVLGEALGWWRTDPWPVLAVAVLVCLAGRRR